MADIEMIGVPFDGYGRAGHQARAAAALRDAGLRDAFDHHHVIDDDDIALPDPDPNRGASTSLINEPALLAMTEALNRKVGEVVGAGRFPFVYGGDCSTLLGIVTGLRDMFHLGAIQPEHLTEARVMIESIVVRTACARATAQDVAALNANIEAAEKATHNELSFYDQAVIHLDFHRVLARATKNPVMVIVMEALIDVMLHFIRDIGARRNSWVVPSRHRFMKHFEAREIDAALAEMEQLLERLNRLYLSLWKEKDRAEAANG